MQAPLAHHAPATGAASQWRWPLLAGALLSMAAHAVVLDALRASGAPNLSRVPHGVGAMPGGQEGGTHRPMRIRTVTLATPLAMPAPVKVAQSDRLQEVPHQVPPTAKTEDEALPPTEAQPDTSANASRNTHDAFIPRPQLTLAPVPQAPVVLTAPESDTEPARRVGVLALYIDETGRVHHIEPDEPRLPPPYERAAREAFMTAVYTPGQLDGRSVKSRIRVEVVFDNTPLEAP